MYFMMSQDKLLAILIPQTFLDLSYDKHVRL